MEKQKSQNMNGGLVTCFFDNVEVTVIKLSPKSMTIRLDKDFLHDNCTEKPILKVEFYIFNECRYDEVIIKNYVLKEKISYDFYLIYSFSIINDKFSENVKYISSDYSRYIDLKNNGIGNEYSKAITGYPSELDYDFYSFFSDAKRQWLLQDDEHVKNISTTGEETEIINIMKDVELAVSLHDDVLWKRYLEDDIDSFMKDYLIENYCENNILFKKKISRIYIGSEVCHNLFPDGEMLLKIMDKAKNEKLKITVCFTYVKECYVDITESNINRLYDWCMRNNIHIEIVFNDWGMLKLLKGKEDYFKISLGILLNKRMKDPRYIYKKGYSENKKYFAGNIVNGTIFTEFLKANNIERYEYESCGYKMIIAEGNNSLHMPFYVTNTSQYCPLYAMCKNMDRGKQVFVKDCPKYCNDYVFSYPMHLKMVGRYNSIFALDSVILKDYEMIREYVNSGIDRIVLNYL